MRPEELRIGNTILRNGIVVKVDHQTLWDIEKYPEKYQEVELTEEWLIRMGFVIRYFNDDENLPIWWKVINNRHIDIFPHPKFNFYFLINSLQMSTPLKYIHQLQNLFYCLAGEELTANLNKM